MKQLFTTFAAAIVILFSQNLNAVTWTWVGGTNTGWNTKSNWTTTSPAAVPQTTDDVIINAGTNNPRLNASYTIRSLEINAGATLDLRQRTLTVSNAITLNGGAFTNTNGTTTGRVVANGAVTLNAPNNFTIIAPATVEFRINSTFTFSDGVLYTNSTDIVEFLAGSSASGASGNSFIDGPVTKIGNTAFTFPIGNGNFFAPLTMSAPAIATTEYNAQYFASPYVNTTTLAAGLDHISNVEHWIFNKVSGSDVNVTLSFHTGRSGIVNSLADLRVAKWNGAQWQSFGNGGTSGSTSNGTVVNSVAITSFSPFTLGSFSTFNPLPVQLLNFDATIINKEVKLNWSTTSEINSKNFTIEKSLDGKTWTEVAVVPSQGSTESVNNYELSDANPVKGIQYYRLKQNDYNGSSNYFDKKSVNFSTIVSSTNLYPNPCSDILNVDINSEDEFVTITVSNTMGQMVFETTQNTQSTLSIDLSNLNSGVYHVAIQTSKGVEILKISKK